MSIEHTVEIFCPSCRQTMLIRDAATFFGSPSQKCNNCDAEIRTGSQGIDEQIVLCLRNDKSLLQAIKIYKQAKGLPLLDSKLYVERMAVQNGIKIESSGINIKAILAIIAIIIIAVALFFSGYILSALMIK